ncbi:diacylglycerol kinase family protein [Corynebacterium bovis]|uniref:Diacylglycerol kinase n=3 Tax=Corynebacterium bovis TaxID=36808 RepID=A0A426Q291_9CORY|nr:diacylglycerol kinase family protein [Corynebacterium bovis]RRO90742.1 diacylglycerol kinase [Corynebacterium bovis]RRO98779.1 diacylglycerol kinase [Corynebacterium bovis]RRO98966.1 diacylglycerol kinase [Corynebacterium bovis]RRQ01779.1 diacylglycerol kinase [Corynebacterium bovis]RRQ05925.1 diacylglycerol kinase [Corynebacterium bovis]
MRGDEPRAAGGGAGTGVGVGPGGGVGPGDGRGAGLGPGGVVGPGDGLGAGAGVGPGDGLGAGAGAGPGDGREDAGLYAVGEVDVRRVALLTNPAAGKGTAVAAADAARRRFGERGVDVVSIQGASPASSRELAAQAVADDRIDALVVCGGDGLINLALQEQAGTGTPLGIIPAGTGNDHAREYRIPMDPRRAADVVVGGFTTTTDLGLMTRRAPGARGGADGAGVAHGPGARGGVDRAPGVAHGAGASDGVVEQAWFGTIACAGFDSLVSDRTNRIAWPTGRARYNLAIVMEFLNFHSIPTRLVLDHERVIEDHMTLVAMGNTRSYGGGMLICPQADHHDGLLDVTVLERMNRFRAAAKFGTIFSGEFVNEPGISTYRARHISIEMESTPPISCYADGDRFAPLPVEVEVVRAAGRYIVPRP